MLKKEADPTETVRVVTDAEALRSQLPPRAALHLYHRDGNTVLTLAANDAVVVGRARPADVVITDPSISRAHARFVFDGENVGVVDLGSTNGTRVNGNPTTPHQLTLIGPGDDVAVGNVVVLVHRLSRGERRPVGFDSHERLTDSLRDEIGRARHFNRSVALMFIAARVDGAHVSGFAPDVQKHLRAVDRMALYSPQVLEVLLPEYKLTEARALAEKIVAGRSDLAVGVVAFPDEGDSVDRMLDAARDALKQARGGGGSGVVVVESGPRPVINSDAPLAISPVMTKLFEDVDKFAARDFAVLIQGETGAGKEVIAQELHARSPRAVRPIVAINCAALAPTLLQSTLFGHMKGAFTGADKDKKGVFESAEGGTVFLDEIGELSADAQAMLLRVLENKIVTRLGAETKEIKVDARIIAATHRDLQEMCDAGTFRSDLFHRLDELSLVVPPLRLRREEIPPLAQRFLQRADPDRRITGFDDEAQAALDAYHWPGNVRELRNVVNRAAVLATGRLITVDDFPDAVRRAAREGSGPVPASDRPSPLTPTPRARTSPSSPLPVPPPSPPPSPSPPSPPASSSTAKRDYQSQKRALEAQLLIDALRRNNGVQVAAARELQMPIRTFVHKLRVLGIRRGQEYAFDEEGGTIDDDAEDNESA